MKSKLKKVVAFFMAFLLTVTVIPENLFASSAAEEATPTDAEGVTGYVTLEVTGFDSLNPAGISYSIYSDSECSDENKVDTLVLSADGKCYVDSEGEVTVYSNTEDLTGTKEAYYAALTAGNYYLKMDALLYDTSNGMETTGISYNREVIEFAISDENPVTLTTEVSIIEETSEEDDSDADFSDDSNTTEVITLSDDEDATEEETEEVATSTDADEEGTEELIGVSALTTAYSLLRSATLTATNQVYITNRASSWSIGQSYGGTFNATYNGTTYAAYCGDHYKDQPSSGYYSVTEVTGSSTSDVNIRRVMAYVIDNYGTGTSISNTNRGYISLAINNAKGNKSVSAGNTIKNKAYAAFSSNPLTGSQVSFSLSSTSLTTSSAATITPSGSSSSVSVRTTSLITLTGNTNNYITVSLPAGMFMSYNSKWYGSNSSTTSVTIHASSSGTASLRFAISASYTGDKEATFTGSAGYNVYRTNSPSGYQYIYWGYKVSAKTVTLTATNEVGYLRILKTSDTASTSSNSGCTKAVFTVTDSTGTVATGTIGYGYTTYNDGTYYCINNKCWEVTEYGESIGAKASYASAFPLENIDGNEYILRLPVGKYTITETTIPDLYVSTTTSKTITITAGKMASPTTVTWTNEKDTGGLKLHKRYASGFASSYCSSLSNYSREGAVYEVYTTTNAKLYDAIEYIYNPKKTEEKYIDFYGADQGFVPNPGNVYERMIETKTAYNKLDSTQAFHFKLSFPAEDNVTPELAMLITKEFIETCFPDFEVAFSVHTNTAHIHSHMVINSVSHNTGKKYHYGNGDWQRILQPAANRVCQKYGMSGFDLGLTEDLTIEHKKTPVRHTADAGTYTNKMIMRDVDECINAAASYAEWKELLVKKGHIVDDSPTHKYITIKAPGRSKSCRIVNLTPDKSTYTKENIVKMISGTYVKYDREEIRQRLSTDMKRFFESGYLLNINGSYKKVNIFDVEAFVERNDIKTPGAADRMLAYLDAADKELNIMRKSINRNLDAKGEAIEQVREIVKLYSSYERYKKGDIRFKDEYDKTVSLYTDLKSKGYDINTLYKLNAEGEKCVNEINEYKKQIYLQKKVCRQAKKYLADKKEINNVKKTIDKHILN